MYRSLVPTLAAAGALVLGASPARAQFVEPDARTLRAYEGVEAGDWFGWVGANLGDLDGDGVDDLAIPAPAEDGFEGSVTVFSGADGTPLHRIEGGFALGYSVSSAGDVDADGVPDYIVGGGRVAVFSGADHGVLLELTATTGFGDSVSGAGDLDGDGHDDVVVGSQFDATASPAAGRVFALSGADGSVLWTREGAGEGHTFGSGIGDLGDVTHDGVPEVVVGAAGAGEFGGGLAYVLDGRDGSIVHELPPVAPAKAVRFGEFFASGAGDVDGDRIPDVFVGDYAYDAFRGAAFVYSGRTGARIHYFPGIDPGDGMGPGRGVGDVNGDRYADLLVGAYLDSDGGPDAGKAYLYSGRSGALLRTITATVESDNFGVDALGAGDVDGDGLPDYLVTAVGLSFAGLEPGRAYVINGTVLPCPSDVTGDGKVTFRDFLYVRGARGTSDPRADLDGDRVVDDEDLDIVFLDRGRCPAGVPDAR